MRINHIGDITQNVWRRLSNFFPIRHDEWVIMPNHLHGIIWILESGTGEASTLPGYKESIYLTVDASPQHEPIGTQVGSLGAIIQNFKSISTRKINQWIKNSHAGESSAPLSDKALKSRMAGASLQRVWQRNYYEHIIRNQLELDRIRKYIADNTYRWEEDQENRE